MSKIGPFFGCWILPPLTADSTGGTPRTGEFYHMDSAPTVLGDFQTEFFAPAATDLIDSLIGEYRQRREKINQVAGIVAGDLGSIIHYFMSGNGCDKRGYSSLNAERLFQPEGAIAALNSAYWSKALALTDVLDVMPQARRDEWNKQITDMTAPEFSEDAVRPTISALLSARAAFLAERVDGLFRNLSGEHVTNSPMGFGKRMIIAGVHDMYYSTERCGYINDLRAVIAKFMGRDAPSWRMSQPVVKTAMRKHGKWLSIDGGALRIRVYLKGTAHLEVHPDMAWRLNCILAAMHPTAIPAEFRQKPKKPVKPFDLMQRPLPFAVLAQLVDGRCDKNKFHFSYGASVNTDAYREALRVLQSLGGVLGSTYGAVAFDYDPAEVIGEVISSGCLPDQVSHQFYPTPDSLAREAVALADILPDSLCLEPSAGQGNIADILPKERTTCVEVSELHCKVLQAKGHKVVNADFLRWNPLDRFDRIVMNPPFSAGRWQAHLLHAAALLRHGGRLVAILPASARGKDVLPGFKQTWSREYRNEFAGTSISIAIVVGEKI